MKKLVILIIVVLLVIIWFKPGIIPGGEKFHARMESKLGGLTLKPAPGIQVAVETPITPTGQVAVATPVPAQTFAQRMAGTRLNLQEVRATTQEVGETAKALGEIAKPFGVPIGTIIGALIGVWLGFRLLKWLFGSLKAFGEWLASLLFTPKAMLWGGALVIMLYVGASGYNIYQTARQQGVATAFPQLQTASTLLGFVVLGVMWWRTFQFFDLRSLDIVDLILKGLVTIISGAISGTALANAELGNTILSWLSGAPVIGKVAQAVQTSQVASRLTAGDFVTAVALLIAIGLPLTLAFREGEEEEEEK